MGRSRTFVFCLAAVAAVSLAQAKDYPERPVKIIVPYPAGGAVDVIARIVAQKLSEGSAGQFYVENLAGAGGDIGARAAAAAPPDDQTILVISPDFVSRPLVKKNAPYDPLASFAPVTLIATSPAVVTVHPSIQARTMKELVDLLKAGPGKYTIGTPGYGTVPHLEAERFYRLTYGLDVVHVPFQGFGPAVTSSVGGTPPFWARRCPSSLPIPRTGRCGRSPSRARDALRRSRTSDACDVANQEAGFAGGLVVPAGTPADIIGLLHRRIAMIVSEPDVKERLAALGFDPVANTPEEFRPWIKAELDNWREVVGATKISIE
jgi:tripartite-type tricarboxylate transporter receptor subunit TctC